MKNKFNLKEFLIMAFESSISIWSCISFGWAVAKIGGLLHMSWLFVFSPIIIGFSLSTIIFLIYVLVDKIKSYKKKKNEKMD